MAQGDDVDGALHGTLQMQRLWDCVARREPRFVR
jgi:hypothetical protein